ncbi:Uncharacterized protein RNJ44_02314 [Nakaseomyces bracarensis]|uniref:non-specific serine/threonine protein kinase n=1 Tax=Nakaseomyces bracarensis TaxID=273131 RepID=A0ABR4NN65_9SACH
MSRFQNSPAVTAANTAMNVNMSYVNGSSSTVANGDDSTIVGLHYKIGKKIGEGSFGVLFEGTNMINGMPVAIKFEPRKTEAPQLKDEYRTYKIMTGTPNVPQAYYFGQEGLHNILVIDLLGPSLEDLFDWCGRKFSVKTVVQVAVQMVTLIEDLHAHDLIYRDIKPDNFLIGRPGQPDENKIHLIDFGMAKQYRDPKTKQHIPYRERKSLSGTARYMSINTHLGREQSRRDDMEALGHVFFYFLRGQLPWQGLKAPNNKQKYEKIGEKKRTTNVYDLASGLPVQFGRYLEIVRNLSFEETPDYQGYRKLLLSALDDINETADGQYDWMKLNGGRGWDLSINKKPNLHGYGHPNPPNDKSRRHKNKMTNPLHQLSAQQQMQYQEQGPQAQPNNHQAGIGGNGDNYNQMANRPNGKNLDPTSYEAYQQQLQQKYNQQSQRPQRQQQMPLQNQRTADNVAAGRNYNNPAQGQDMAGNRYRAQQEPNTAQQAQQPQAPAPQTQNNFHQHTEQMDNEYHSTNTEKGFFQKLGCC